MIRKKKEVIPFNVFMEGKYKQKITRNTHVFYSFMSVSTFLDGGTLLIIGVGILAIGLALYESHAAHHGDMLSADIVSLVGNLLLHGGGIAFLLYFLLNMPILHWF